MNNPTYEVGVAVAAAATDGCRDAATCSSKQFAAAATARSLGAATPPRHKRKDVRRRDVWRDWSADAATAGKKDAATSGEDRLPLPQQLARRTPQRLWNNDPKTQNKREPVTKCRTREQGDNRDRWQHEDDLDSSIYSTAPETRRRCQRSEPSESSRTCLLAPSTHQEVLNRIPVPVDFVRAI